MQKGPLWIDQGPEGTKPENQALLDEKAHRKRGYKPRGHFLDEAPRKEMRLEKTKRGPTVFATRVFNERLKKRGNRREDNRSKKPSRQKKNESGHEQRLGLKTKKTMGGGERSARVKR